MVEQRPSQGQLQQFLNLPQQGGRGFSDAGKVGVGVAAGALGLCGGAAIAGIPEDREGKARYWGQGGSANDLDAGDRLQAGTLPAERPGAGERPDLGRLDRAQRIALSLPSRPNAGQIRDNMSGQIRQSFYAPMVEGSSQYGPGLLAKLGEISIVEARHLGCVGRLGGRKFLGLSRLL